MVEQIVNEGFPLWGKLVSSNINVSNSSSTKSLYGAPGSLEGPVAGPPILLLFGRSPVAVWLGPGRIIDNNVL